MPVSTHSCSAGHTFTGKGYLLPTTEGTEVICPAHLFGDQEPEEQEAGHPSKPAAKKAAAAKGEK